LGLSSIHTTDQSLQQRIFGEAIEIAIPFAVHCRRLIELVRHRKTDFKIPLRCSLEIDERQKFEPCPRDFWVAVNALIHSRTIRGGLARMRECEPAVKADQGQYAAEWAKEAQKARDREYGADQLGSSGNNPWRLTPVLIVETDQELESDQLKETGKKNGKKDVYEKVKKVAFPAVALADTYFELIEPEVDKIFGSDINKWSIWDVL
jgi:hypothetical protein